MHAGSRSELSRSAWSRLSRAGRPCVIGGEHARGVSGLRMGQCVGRTSTGGRSEQRCFTPLRGRQGTSQRRSGELSDTIARARPEPTGHGLSAPAGSRT